MSAAKSPLGPTWTGKNGDPVVEVRVPVRITRDELLGTLSDAAVTSLLLEGKLPWPPSSAPVRRVRQVVESRAHNWGGSLPWDETSSADENHQERALVWANKVLDRVWPVV